MIMSEKVYLAGLLLSTLLEEVELSLIKIQLLETRFYTELRLENCMRLG